MMIAESEVWECPEYEVKSKIGNIFVNEKVLEEYSVKIYEIDPYFYEHYKKIQVDENGHEYILFKFDDFFLMSFSCRNWWKRSYWQRPYFWVEKTRSPGKKTWL